MSTLSFGFPPLLPRDSREAWFPPLEAGELDMLEEMEIQARQESERMREFPWPKHIGASNSNGEEVCLS
ncbi:unnamed protein product [Discosporangium mesarthrocarpum]